MPRLELRIPPLALAAAFACAIALASAYAPLLRLPIRAHRFAAVSLAISGLAIAVAGVLQFRRARTTVNPTSPERTSVVVTTGLYRWSRNPMYLGMALILVAWAVFLASPWAFVGPAFWVFYMGRFQIKPEERILAGLFGEEYARYLSIVRRWL
jgi:protein-S-isoprenylcysteine O-methyltransferase Ste14